MITSDQSLSLINFCRALTTLNKAKLAVEYEVMNLRAKGLLPIDAQGTPPPALTVTADGLIEGTDMTWEVLAAALGGVNAIEATLAANDHQVENAILCAQKA